jgi:hypothetical protein
MIGYGCGIIEVCAYMYVCKWVEGREREREKKRRKEGREKGEKEIRKGGGKGSTSM